MKVLVAPSAYKGSFHASAVADAIAKGVRRVHPDARITCAPIADGGDGTIESIHQATGGQLRHLTVTGPTGEMVEANWLDMHDQAIVELASACGLAYLAQGALSPLYAHTQGLGEVLQHCLLKGFRRVVVCVGDSASTDGGAGALTALGARFLNASNRELPSGGSPLIDLCRCDLSALSICQATDIAIAVDVDIPLLGASGAARIFSPQKGADREQVAVLDKALEHYADILERAAGRECRNLPGSGAAGGTAFGLACALRASIVPGFAWVSRLIGLKERIADSDVVITAEGRLDSQSIMGKGLGGLAKMCLASGRPLWVVPALAQADVDWTQYGIRKVAPAATRNVRATLDDVTEAASRLFDEQ